MGELFGGSGGGPRQPGSSFPIRDDNESGRRGSSFLEFDNLTGEMVINLPPQYAKYQKELFEDLYHEFRFENPDDGLQDNMEAWIRDWIQEREDQEA